MKTALLSSRSAARALRQVRQAQRVAELRDYVVTTNIASLLKCFIEFALTLYDLEKAPTAKESLELPSKNQGSLAPMISYADLRNGLIRRGRVGRARRVGRTRRVRRASAAVVRRERRAAVDTTVGRCAVARTVGDRGAGRERRPVGRRGRVGGHRGSVGR